MSEKAKKRRSAKSELSRANKELHTIQNSLDQAYYNFNNNLDAGLTEAYIYEINALRARYDHTLRMIKTRLE